MKLPQIILACGALSSALFFTGCATITRGSTEEFKVESTPAGANVRLDTGQTGIAPATFTVSRKKDIVVTVSKEGYVTQSQTVTTKISGRGGAGLAGNILVGGIIGIGVDAISGATLNHYPNPLVINLQQVGAPAPAADAKPAEEKKPAETKAAAPAPASGK